MEAWGWAGFSRSCRGRGCLSGVFILAFHGVTHNTAPHTKEPVINHSRGRGIFVFLLDLSLEFEPFLTPGLKAMIQPKSLV